MAEARSGALVILLLCASITSAVEFDTVCTAPDPSPLDFDLFETLLSNFTAIAEGLKPAPVFADMEYNRPAYTIDGEGFHLSSPGLSQDLKRALCSTNEVTFYASMFLREARSSGTLLQISSGRGARLPIFGVSLNARADEFMFTYLHRGSPQTVSVDLRLHPGRWRKYAFSLSGHLLQLYFDCELVYSDIIALPDFCSDESSFVITFADDVVKMDTEHANGIHGFFQNVGFHFGRGGLRKQCPQAARECPTCGQYLQLVERAYLLREENEQLKARIEELESLGVAPQSESQDCYHNDMYIHDGGFVVMDDAICYCQNGDLSCSDNMTCQETPSNDPPTPIVCDPPCSQENQHCEMIGEETECVCDSGFSLSGDECVADGQVCTVKELPAGQNVLQVGQMGYLFEDSANSEPDQCRVFSCILFGQTPFSLAEQYECGQNYTETGCSSELDQFQQNMAVCCQICTYCDFLTCDEKSECTVTNYQAVCECDQFHRKNETTGDCTDIDECEENPDICADENAVCFNEQPRFRCLCVDGYEKTLTGCQDINECAPSPSPCSNNSICVNTPGSFECDCISGYTKTEDGVCAPVCTDPCLNGGTCIEPETCSCLSGFTGPQCESDIDECEVGTHKCTDDRALCINTFGGHFCRCRTGYEGNGTHCRDINECDSDIYSCVFGSKYCLNTIGSFLCLCPDKTDCTGYCRRWGQLFRNGESTLARHNPCLNCTCLNGELVCRPKTCDCKSTADNPNCCSHCLVRDCILDDGTQIRPSAMHVDPADSCLRYTCSQNLKLTMENLTSECPILNCPERFQRPQPGKCCRICLLPMCTQENDGDTLSMNNGCDSCTCKNETWSCNEVISCPLPSRTQCRPQEILFYDKNCCPICEQDVSAPTCLAFSPLGK